MPEAGKPATRPGRSLFMSATMPTERAQGSAQRTSAAAGIGLVVLIGCRTTGMHEDAPPAKTIPAAEVARVPGDAAVDAAPSPAQTTAVTAVHPVIEGACPSATPYEVGTSGVLVIRRGAWMMTTDGARSLYQMAEPRYDPFVGAVMTGDHVGQVGGADEAHAWVQTRSSTGRGEDFNFLQLRTTRGWTSLETPHGNLGFFSITRVFPQPNGTLWAYAHHSMYLDIPGDQGTPPEVSHDRYFAWSADGMPLTMNLPGADMQDAVRMASGELVAVGVSASGKSLFRRWSPVKKVDDLIVPGSPAPGELSIGTARAVVYVKAKRAFHIYAGAALRPSALNPRVRDVASWLLTTADELMVTMADGTLLVESKDGVVTEEKLPEAGRLAREPSHPWLIAKSGVLYTRAADGWRKIPVPASPWATETHPPDRIEWVRTIGGETWVSTVRTDGGFGQKKPGEVRTLFSSRARPAPLRCGSPFPNVGLAPFPPKAGPDCASPVVVIASERDADAKMSYPKIAAALKGNAALGESLTFVGFGPGPDRLLGILSPTPVVAKELTRKLTPVTSHAHEIVFGAPQETRRFALSVKNGTFAAP